MEMPTAVCLAHVVLWSGVLRRICSPFSTRAGGTHQHDKLHTKGHPRIEQKYPTLLYWNVVSQLDCGWVETD